jgi:predicted transcriptional regulator
MKTHHLTLRLAADLARALARRARERGLPRSQLVREAVIRYLAPEDAAVAGPPDLTARQLARRWAQLPRLTPGEAEALAGDIAAAREALPPTRPQWD